MSSLGTLESDEDYEEFRDVVLSLMENMGDPEQVNSTVRREGYENAIDDIQLSKEEYENRLERLQSLADEITDRHPGLVEELKSEIDQGDTERSSNSSGKTDRRSGTAEPADAELDEDGSEERMN